MNLFIFQLIFVSTVVASQLTHGPMVEHTSDSSSSIWIRADSESNFNTGKRILYTTPGALRSLWHSPA
jgi:hypothetical protein